MSTKDIYEQRTNQKVQSRIRPLVKGLTMYIAKGMYRTTEIAETEFDALITLLLESTTPAVKVDDSWQVTLKADSYYSSTYSYSTEWDPYDALEDAVLCNYKKFNIRLFKEV